METMTLIIHKSQEVMLMRVYTCQMAKHRKVTEKGIKLKDITVKSGDKRFSPTWDILMKSKKGGTEKEYTKEFIPLMRKSYRDNKQAWLDLCKEDEVCLMCYCKTGDFCHRHIIVDLLEKICKNQCIEFTRGGEIL